VTTDDSAQVSQPSEAYPLAVFASICPGRRILRQNEQACGWMLQPLGWWMLAATRSNLVGAYGQPVQQRGYYTVYLVLLSRSDGTRRPSGQAWKVRCIAITCRPTACANIIRFSDPYHSCYVLAGLSVAQHHFEGLQSTEPASSSVEWSITPLQGADQVFLETDRVGTLHPAFAIPVAAVEQTQQYFRAKRSF
jgi:hypothetical protein